MAIRDPRPMWAACAAIARASAPLSPDERIAFRAAVVRQAAADDQRRAPSPQLQLIPASPKGAANA